MARNAIQVRVRGSRQIRARLSRLPAAVQDAAATELAAVAEALRSGIRDKMPRDTGTAADSLVVLPAGESRILVTFDEARIEAVSPDRFSYPTVIEFGSVTLNRPPVAPMRRTVDEIGLEAVQDAVRRVRDQVERDLSRGEP